MKHILPLLALLLLPSCSLLGLDDESVTARSRGDAVIVKNGTSERVYYFVVGRQLAEQINWAQSVDPRISIAPGNSRGIPYDDISQERGGEEEAIVYWWHAERQGDEVKPGELNSTILELE